MLNARSLQPPKRLFTAAPCPAFLFRTASRTACCLRRLFPLQVARFLSTCSFGTQGIQAIKAAATSERWGGEVGGTAGVGAVQAGMSSDDAQQRGDLEFI